MASVPANTPAARCPRAGHTVTRRGRGDPDRVTVVTHIHLVVFGAALASRGASIQLHILPVDGHGGEHRGRLHGRESGDRTYRPTIALTVPLGG
jgi:hypothetical protein